MEHYRQVIQVFTPNELAVFMQMLKSELDQLPRWNSASILNDAPINKAIRDTDSKVLKEDFLSYQVLHAKINQAAERYGQMLQEVYKEAALTGPTMCAPGTKSWHQSFEILRYKPGQHYTWHVDQSLNDEISAIGHHRTVSVVLYLTDDFEGGGTEFPDRVFKPKAGEALFFPSSWCYPHRGQQVTQGEKIACVTWYEVYD